MRHFKKFCSKGQGMVEYIILTALIALAAITAVMLFGKQEKKQFAGMTQALAGKTAVIDDQIVQQQAQEEAVNPSMKKYGGESSSSGSNGTATETSSSGSVETPSTASPVTPSDSTSTNTPPPSVSPPSPTPPPPPTPTVLTNTSSEAQRHHIGDGNYSTGLGGSGLINEGITYAYTFSALKGNPKTQKVNLSFESSGVNLANNTILLNGNPVGIVTDGLNSFEFTENTLLETNRFEILSGTAFVPGLGNDNDDFEFWNFNVVRYDSQA